MYSPTNIYVVNSLESGNSYLGGIGIKLVTSMEKQLLCYED